MDEIQPNAIENSEEIKGEIVKILKETPIISVACKKAGISRSTYYRWEASDLKFASASKESRRYGRLHVNDIAESQIIKMIQNGNFPATKYWLAFNCERYRPRIPTPEKVENVSELTPEMIREIDRLFEKNQN